MIYQTQKYKLVANKKCINIETYLLPINTKLHYTIYKKSDYNYTNPITSGDILTNQKGTDCISHDGSYVIHIQIIPISKDCFISDDDTIGYFYDFSIYENFRLEYLEIVLSDICTCSECENNKLSDCDNCIENSDLKNKYNSFIFQIFYNLYYSNIVNIKGFFNYLKEVISDYENPINTRFLKMISYGNIRGIFELDDSNRYILIVALYIYQFYKEIQESDNIEHIDIDYALNDVKQCIINNGLNFENFERILFNTNYFGKVFTVHYDCQGETDCTKVLDIINNIDKSFNKTDITTLGITINIESIQDRMVIAIPKVWNLPTEIRDESNTNIISEFNLLDLNGFYIFISKDNYSQGIYKIKFKYYE